METIDLNQTRPTPHKPWTLGKYFITNILGSGSFGIVYSAYDTVSKSKFALKQLKKSQINKTERNQRLFQDEVDITSTIRHRNVVHLHEVYETPNHLYLVYDLCEKGTLF